MRPASQVHVRTPPSGRNVSPWATTPWVASKATMRKDKRRTVTDGPMGSNHDHGHDHDLQKDNIDHDAVEPAGWA
jgi:hypothetical protein